MSLRIHQILAAVLTAVSVQTASPAADTNEILVERAFIPTAQNRHGEVRLVRRGDVHCVQTLLYSAELRRGLKEIRNREMEAWPSTSPHHVESVHYLDLLKQAEEAVWKDFANRQDRTDGRAKLLIEFSSAGDAASVALYEPQLSGPPDDLVVVSAQPLGRMTASADYVNRAMDLMMAGAFPAARNVGPP